ncbi:MAG: hypothetical protein FRX48_05990 [Lasallia pustulata]|uniref:AHC1-like C2H2 zinc-finger domain-containing protein n=1 Tax=Lasallia pustulata TaxID=136370 RepID=A0A5M8PNJ0_9LECA|nr:MAG: hypothetical protein FRX48_05990 [Lasallia pustulata]
MFLLPWGTGAKNDKEVADKARALAAKQQRPAVVEIPLSTKMKRKRRESEDSPSPRTGQHLEKKRTNQMSHVEVARGSGECHGVGAQVNGHPAPAPPPPEVKTPDATMEREHLRASETCEHLPTGSVAQTLSPLQETIEAQFSLEILLKHNELRLIETELAKCQSALEQLRRCQVIPFPATSSTIGDMQAVSNGAGAALEPQDVENPPQDPPPWGVSEGPYTRHYARWLIPDSVFGGGSPGELQTPRAEKSVPESRTRKSVSEKGSVSGQSRSQRGSAGSRLQALPNGYANPREDKGPLILKRSTDGKIVKLVCLNCRRDNFNSAQGFINHCRIAHNRGFASHDAAAIACGEEVDVDEAGSVVGEQTGTGGAGPGLVHPLIRSAHLQKSSPTTPATSTLKRKRTPSKLDTTAQSQSTFPRDVVFRSLNARNHATPELSVPNQTPFSPSPQTPHLSALFAKTGFGGNLSEMVIQAKIKTDLLAELSSEDSEDDEDTAMEDAASPRNRSSNLGTRLPARATMSPAPLERSPSRKGLDSCKPSRKPGYLSSIIARNTAYSSPYASASTPTPSSLGDMPQSLTPANDAVMLDHTSLNLSPNTIESNPAPSLTSDDGMDYENTHSESETSSSDADDDDEVAYVDHVEVENDEDDVGGSESTTSDLGLATAGAKAHPATAARRSSAMRSRSMRAETDERHVSFASPARSIQGRGKKQAARRGDK